MKRTYWIYLFLLSSPIFWIGCNKNEPPQEEKEEKDEVIIWTGPGWYYGIWFETEPEFHEWYHGEHHRHDRHRDHDNRGDHRGDGHSGHSPRGGSRGGGGRR